MQWITDFVTHVAEVVGTPEDLFIRLAVEGTLATVGVFVVRTIFRVRWKKPETAQKKLVTERVVRQKGWGHFLLHLPLVLAVDLLRLGVIFLRGIHLLPAGRDDAHHNPPSSDEVHDD